MLPSATLLLGKFRQGKQVVAEDANGLDHGPICCAAIFMAQDANTI
jgi:hypothetical protein